MKSIVLVIAILVILSVAPNCIWLMNSTARITNIGIENLSSVIVYVDDKETNLGELPPGKSRFIFLPKSGDATYKVSYAKGSRVEFVCQEYVEGNMYHVDTFLPDTKGSKCKVTLPLVSSLFIFKML